jgi:hypothetical protein
MGISACCTIFFLLCASTVAFSGDLQETLRKTIAHLRTESMQLATDASTNSRRIAEIGILQARLGDSDGAVRSFKAIADQRSPFTRQLADQLATAQALSGNVDAAILTIMAVHWPGWDRQHCQSMLRVAQATAKAGNLGRARRLAHEVIHMVNDMSDSTLRQMTLFDAAVTQHLIGDRQAAINTRASMAALVNVSPSSDPDRGYHLMRLGTLSANLADRQSAIQYYAQALGTTSAASTSGSHLFRLIAVAQANAGDVDAGVHTALSIPATFYRVKDRELALEQIALLALTTHCASKGESIASLITQYTSIRDRAFHRIGVAYARINDLTNAMRVCGRIGNLTQRAHAMLDLARIVAEGGDKQRAREMANAITYPTMNPYSSPFPNQQLDSFRFGDPSSWAQVYESSVSIASAHSNEMKAVDLSAAAMACYVAIEGTSVKPDARTTGWNKRRLAKALTEAGDLSGSLVWIENAESNRLDVVLGVAEGLAERLEKHKDLKER